ncbi:MAG: hypothetical protein KJZ80_16365 [Hyphomicrobiaceae bacterium]|nr:hypothetical protein [Hyphomicrobiaceae bacterium]
MATRGSSKDQKNGFGWYVSFALIAVVAFIGIGAFTGQEALAAAARVLWNGFALVFNGIMRLFGGLLGLLARGVGWRRLTRIANVVGGVGLGYAASVVLSDETVQRARGWRGRLKTALAVLKGRWQDLPLALKLVIVATLIASQVYLHTVLIVFPIAFLIPIVRRLWVRTADMLFGSWYWRIFGGRHRRIVCWLRSLPGLRGVIGWTRLTRIRYLAAWRLWKYHPRYLDQESGCRAVSFVEPIRLWWRGELDGYVGRPLFTGGTHRRERVPDAAPHRTSLGRESADRQELPRAS